MSDSSTALVLRLFVEISEIGGVPCFPFIMSLMTTLGRRSVACTM